MELTKCKRGHYYNASIHPSCPKCEALDIGVTKPLEEAEDIPKTTYVGYNEGFRPVVGWLACIEGPDKGVSYEIKTDYNYIGRNSSMDITISDDAISGENHAVLGFDLKNSSFLFGPMAGKSLVRVNGNAVLSTVLLKPWDRIEIGKSVLVFVPLCGEHFHWEDEKPE